MELETEEHGVLENPGVEDVRRVFKRGAVVGRFIRLSRSVDDFLHVELDVGDEGGAAAWKDDIKGVFYYDPQYGRGELEEWSPEGYRSEQHGGSPRQQLREMFLQFLAGPDAFAKWHKEWNGKFRGEDC